MQRERETMSFKKNTQTPELKTFVQAKNNDSNKSMFHAAAKRGDGIDATTRDLMQKMLSGRFAPAN